MAISQRKVERGSYRESAPRNVENTEICYIWNFGNKRKEIDPTELDTRMIYFSEVAKES